MFQQFKSNCAQLCAEHVYLCMFCKGKLSKVLELETGNFNCSDRARAEIEFLMGDQLVMQYLQYYSGYTYVHCNEEYFAQES